MTYGSDTGGYSGFAKLLHWVIAACVLVLIPVGILIVWVDLGPWGDTLFNLHKSFGVLVLILVLIRVLYRLMHGAPAPDPNLDAFRRAASGTVHTLLYILLVVQPILGYAANSAYGAATPFFGLFEISPLLAKNEALSDQLFMYHRWIGMALAVLLAVHIGAALQHYFIRRDDVLQRMLPRAMGGA
jgi:cytochrome b561